MTHVYCGPTALGAAYFREQSRTCLTLARRGRGREQRTTFIRLALHWRAVARAWDVAFAD